MQYEARTRDRNAYLWRTSGPNNWQNPTTTFVRTRSKTTMELAASLIPIICSPACAFVDLDTFGSTSKDESILPAQDYHLYLNELLERFKSPQWRIDGCGGGGTQFFIIPLFMGPEITPSRIDLFIPDRKLHCPELRTKLESSIWYLFPNIKSLHAAAN